MYAKVANSNPTNYIFLRLAINTLSIEHIKSPFFQNIKIRLECLPSVMVTKQRKVDLPVLHCLSCNYTCEENFHGTKMSDDSW